MEENLQSNKREAMSLPFTIQFNSINRMEVMAHCRRGAVEVLIELSPERNLLIGTPEKLSY